MWRDCDEGRVVDDDWQNADDAVTQRLRLECSSTKGPCHGETVVSLNISGYGYCGNVQRISWSLFAQCAALNSWDVNEDE